MTDTSDHSLFFSDGWVVSRSAVIVPAQYNRYPDYDASRVMLRFGEQWTHYDVNNDMIRSVTYQRATNTSYLMGRNGNIHSAGGVGLPFTMDGLRGTFKSERIADVERTGELFRIRAIGDGVYACGQSGQVYVLRMGSWDHMDDGLLSPSTETLEDIDGTGADDIYAVGLLGFMHHFNGATWTRLESPTNQHLSNVRCLSRDEVLVCGDEGTLYRGNLNGWEFIGDPDVRANFWGMHVFRDQIYLAHVNGMMVHNGAELQNVDFGIGRQISCHRVHGDNDVLWSFGVDDLLEFDGENWREIICPENV